MAILIGVDEAGYGPNLGPLVVAATAWRIEAEPADLQSVDLYDVLSGVVSPAPESGRIAVADSKKLYQPGGGLETLERAVLALHGPEVASWSKLIKALSADPNERITDVPWYEGYDPRLPLAANTEEIDEARELLRGARDRCEFVAASARLVFPAEFNALTERWGTKGAALSHTTLELVSTLIRNTTSPTADCPSPTHCICDKHGGRNRYAALLQHHFPDHWIETLDESRASSRYRLGDLSFEFCTGGESHLPVAWGSMTAKYLRELAMKAFNAYWAEQVPGVKPTAGYPVDAKRFKSDITEKQAELGVADGILWRSR